MDVIDAAVEVGDGKVLVLVGRVARKALQAPAEDKQPPRPDNDLAGAVWQPQRRSLEPQHRERREEEKAKRGVSLLLMINCATRPGV